MRREIKLWDREGLAAIHFIHQLERDMMSGSACDPDQQYREAAAIVHIIREWLADRRYSIRLFIDNNCTSIMTYNQMFIGNINRFTEMEWCPVNFTDCHEFSEFLKMPFESESDTKSFCLMEMEHFRLMIGIRSSHDVSNLELSERRPGIN